MENKVLIQIAVGLIVLVFLLEGFYITGASKYIDRGQPTPEESPTPEGLLFGIASANATVVSYPEGVIVARGSGAGADANLSSMLSALQGEGKVAYYDSMEGSSVNIVLAQGANISEVALAVIDGFPRYSVISKAQISIPENMTFQTDAGNVSAPVSSRVFIYMEPLIPVGESTEIVAGAMVGNGTATSLEIQIAQKSAIAPVTGTVAALSSSWVVDSAYPWEDRGVNETLVQERLNERYPNSTVRFTQKSYVVVANMSEAQKDLVKNLSWVSFMIGDTAFAERDFTNRSRAEAELRAISENASVTFPESQLLAGIESSELDEAFVLGVVGGNATILRMGTLELGRFVEIEGKRFIAPAGIVIERALPGNASIGENATQLANVTVRGARLISAR